MSCQHDLHDCTCPDIDVRLTEAFKSENLAARWCSTCDKHYARCRCTTPVWVMRTGGRNEPLPAQVVEAMARGELT